MPYIRFGTNVPVTKAQEQELRERLGRLIELIPGKTEKWLMVEIDDSLRLGLGGDSVLPTAMVTLKAFGREQNDECYDALTKAICEAGEIIIGVAPERLYVEYEVTRQWGWNGKNFGR